MTSNVAREIFPLPGPSHEEIGTQGVSRQTRARARARQQRRQWEADAVNSLNSMHSPGAPASDLGVSAGQVACLNHLREIIVEAGPPPCSPTAAFTELCGHPPGYAAEPAIRVPYQKGSVSLPAAGASCDPGGILVGRALQQWYGWKSHILRKGPSEEAPVRPFCDPTLVRNRLVFAEFILQLYDANLVKLDTEVASTLGVFFVRKGAKQRLIMDTRFINGLFERPSHADLPTCAAWTSLRTPTEGGLHLHQVDVDNCFHRMLAPPGASEYFVLPAVSRSALLELRPSLAQSLPDGKHISAKLLVLPMGWSWPLYFGQLLWSRWCNDAATHAKT